VLVVVLHLYILFNVLLNTTGMHRTRINIENSKYKNQHKSLFTERVVSVLQEKKQNNDDSCKNLIYFSVTLVEDIVTQIFRLVIFSEFVRRNTFYVHTT
jgi:hypothetical protein